MSRHSQKHRATVWQTWQQLWGCKAGTILHIPEQTDNTRAGPVTISNSSHVILWNNWTPHSRAVSLSSTAVHSYCTRLHSHHLAFLPEKHLFPYSLQFIGQNCITKLLGVLGKRISGRDRTVLLDPQLTFQLYLLVWFFKAFSSNPKLIIYVLHLQI